MYYYSSGYVDDANTKVLQGVVKVEPREEKDNKVSVSVAGMEALIRTGSRRVSRASPECVASPQCPPVNDTSDGLIFTTSDCSTPMVYSISPNQGSYHQLIRIQGEGFSDIACANEVRKHCLMFNSY